MSCKSILLSAGGLGGKENKINVYIPLIPAPSTLLRTGFSLKGEGAGTCVDTYANRIGNCMDL
jgi:hypothetical protein